MAEAAHDRLLPPVLLALTATTGLIDAVSYLGLGHVTTTVMTLTLTGLVADPAGGAPRNSRRRTGAVAALLVGALVGALLEKQSLALPLAVAAAIAVAALTGFAWARR